MSYGRGVYRNLECLTCGTAFRRLLFSWSDPDDPRNTPLQNTCPNSDCPQPHIRIRPPQNSSTVQVRESQRAVLYRFPDGTWAQPGSNDPNDPIAQTSIRDGAVRHEFYHVRDMHDFQHSVRKLPTDELSGYNDVVDWDESARRTRDTETIDVHLQHQRERRMQAAFAAFSSSGGHLRFVGPGGDSSPYDRALKEARSRGWVK